MIRLSKLSDYGIVLMTYFARDPHKGVYTARDLAANAQLPLPTVSKILKSLSRGGLLVSHRGVKGGYRLSRPAAEVSIVEIIRAIDGPIALTDCSTSEHVDDCDLACACPVRSNWRKINEAVIEALANLRLPDMTQPEVVVGIGIGTGGSAVGAFASAAMPSSSATMEPRRNMAGEQLVQLGALAKGISR